ncbi:MAG: lamin tail domain-containing protein [Lentisphaerae bacterium]|nr:lamin tail domain-containing protein [Lentisphaerota bacterium]
MRRRLSLLASLCLLSIRVLAADPQLVINELNYNPFEAWPSYQPYPTTNLTEFVELYNAGTATVALADYRFDNGITFAFTNGTLSPGHYAVLCENLPAFASAYPAVTNVVGQYNGSLNNGGERVTLSHLDNGVWLTEDTIAYLDDEDSDGTARSLELVNPALARLDDQFYGDWLASSTVSGTPGRVNSRYTASPLPVAGDVNHSPALPPARSAVKVTARATGRDGDALTVAIDYRKDANPQGVWLSTNMNDYGVEGDRVASDGVYTAYLPPAGSGMVMAEGEVLEFRIRATDAIGTRTFPATNRTGITYNNYFTYLCKFGEDSFSGESGTFPGEYPTYHMLMTKVNQAHLEAPANINSAALRDATIITPDQKIHYNSSVRLRGSGSRVSDRGNYRINFPTGDDYDGYSEVNLNHENALALFMGMDICQRAGIIASDVELSRVYLNEAKKNSAHFYVYTRVETLGFELVKRHYPPVEPLGNLYYTTGSDAPEPSLYGDLSFKPSVSSYATDYGIKVANPYTAWNELQALTSVLTNVINGAIPALTNRVNVRQWGLLYAAMACIDNSEAGYYSMSGYGDELRMYVDPTDGQADLLPWDLSDSLRFGASTDGLTPNIWGFNFAVIPTFLHNRPISCYYGGGLVDIMTNTMSDANMNAMFDRMGSKMLSRRDATLSVVQSQRATILPQLNQNLTVSGLPAGANVLMVPSTNAGAQLVASGIAQQVNPARWILLGTLTTTTTNATVKVTRQTPTPVNQTLADAVMFSNAVAGTVVSDDADPAFTTQGTWLTSPTGGYAGGSYHYSSAASSIATWGLSLPESGTYDIYAWGLTPASGTLESTRYDVSSGSDAVLINLQGTAPQNYTDRVTINGQSVTTWSLRNNAWSSTNAIALPGDVAEVVVRAIHPEGQLLQSLTFKAVGQRTPVIAQGTIAANTEWRPEAGIVVITNDLTIAAGARLSIYPRTTVVFTPGRKLIVNGALDILGSAANPVQILPQGGTTPWLITGTGTNAILTVSNAVCSLGRFAVSAGATLQVYDSTLTTCPDTNGIVQATGATVKIVRSIVRDFNRTRFEDSTTLVDQSVFEAMSAVGLEFRGAAATTTVSRTTLRNPLGTDGISFDHTASGLVTNVLIEGMSGTGLIARASSITMANGLVDACGTALHADGTSTLTSRNNTLVNSGIGVNGSVGLTSMIIWSSTTLSTTNGPATAASSDIQLTGNGVYAGSGNMNRDPFFRSVADRDYQLLSTSPCLGAGAGGGNQGVAYPTGANPAAPTGLALAAASNSVQLTWIDQSSDETAFEVYRSTNRGKVWVLAGTTPPDASHFTDSGLAQNADYTYRVRAVHGRGASAFTDTAAIITPFQTLTQLLVDNLRITEIHYNPPGSGDTNEFLEIKNISTNLLLNLTGLYTDEGRYVFTNGTTLGPQEFFVLARNAAGFAATYPGVPIGGVYAVGAPDLSNSGEALSIRDTTGTDVTKFTYDDNGPGWYPATDGDGFSLVPVNDNPDAGDPSSPLYWRASSTVGGSPGADDPDPTGSGIVINEVLAHTDPPLEDAIELHNIGLVPVDVAGWYLSDTATNLTRYQIPTNTPHILPPGGYGVLYAGTTFNQNTNDPTAFEITELGTEDVYLSAAQGGSLTGYRDKASFIGAIENGVSFGRHARSDGKVDFVAMTSRTFGVDNPTTLAQFRTGTGLPNSAPKVGPVVISEVMYNPGPGGKEYIELQNITGGSVPLFHPSFPTNAWKLRDAVSYTFPLGTTMLAGERVLVVGVDPAEFRQQMGIDSAIRIFGPCAGDLANSRDSVELVKPETPELTGLVPEVIVDRVAYEDAAPWPTDADNTGASLERISASAYGNDPANWVAATIGGTPGSANNTSGAPAVSFRDVSDSSLETNEVIYVDVSRWPADATTVTVSYAVSGGTATSGNDFTLAPGTITFWPHESLKTIPLTIRDDVTPGGESDETIEITLTNVSANALLGGNRVYTHTIIDNDATSLSAPAILPARTTDFTNSIVVEIVPTVANSIIYYTVDGSVPERSDTLYIGPVTLKTSTRLTARTFLGNVNSGSWTSVLFRAQAIPVGWVAPSLQPYTVETSVRASTDDGYQPSSPVSPVNVWSTNIVMPTLGSDYGSCFRFTAANIPQGVNVTNAYVQFTSATNNSGNATINIIGEATNSASTLAAAVRNISNRLQTTNVVPWSLPAWNTSERGLAQRTPNVAAVIKELVARPGWTTNSALALIFRFTSTTSTRSVYSFDGSPDQAALLHVEWAPPPMQFYLTVFTNGAGTVAGGNLFVPDGSNTTVTATALPGHLFAGWSGELGAADTNAAALTVLMNQDRSITANFVPESPTAYFFAVTNDGSGVIIGGNVMVTAGSNASATAVADVGHVFAGWSGDVGAADTNAALLTVLMDQARTVTAHFQALPPSTYFFAVFTNGFGTVTGGNLDVPAGSNVSATAFADVGYAFAGWSGDVSAGDTNATVLTVLMNQDRYVTANFVLMPPPDPARVLALGVASSNQITLTWQSNPAFIYRVFRTTNLMFDRPGETLATNIPGHPSRTNTFIDAAATNRTSFYSIESAYP